MSELNRRVIRASGANGLSLLARVAEQLLLVPILLSAWSVELYGEWLLISAIPIYLSLSDMGFVTAGSNELAKRGGADDVDGVRSFFTDYISFFARWSLLILAAICTAVALVPLDSLLGLETMSRQDAATVFALLAGSALVSQNGLALLGGLRARKRFPVGLLIRALAALLRLIAVFVAVVGFEADPVAVAAITLAVTFGGVVAQALVLWWIELPPVWRLWRRPTTPMLPYLGLGLEFMMMPLAQAIILQGMVILVGTSLGAVAVAVFSTHRTLTRFTSQLLQLAVTPLRAEAGLLQGDAHRVELGVLVTRLSRVTFWLSLVTAATLMVLGPWIFQVWTGDKIAFLPALFLVLILSTVLEGVWRVAASVRLGSNRHRPVVWAYLALSLLGLGLAWAMMDLAGLAGLAWVLVALNAAMMLWVIRVTAPLVDLDSRSYLRSLATPPLQELRALGRRLGRRRFG